MAVNLSLPISHLLVVSCHLSFFIKALTPSFSPSPLPFPLSSSLPTPSFWLQKAIALQNEFDKYLWSVDNGGYYNAASDSSQDLIIRERSYQDNATPSANGIAVANLVRLALISDDLHYLDLATRALKAFRGVMNSAPQACPSLFSALDWYRNSTLIQTNSAQIDSLLSRHLPTVVFSEVKNLPQGSIGLVCQGLKCLPAPASLEQLLQQVQQSERRGVGSRE